MDYKKLGLKCGLEIHQQLNTKKLFCDCPSILRDDKPHFTVERKLKAVSGETGKKDIAAISEESKQKIFTYQGYNNTTCLIELDEEPPKKLNKKALEISLQTSKLLNMNPFHEIQVMRKTVIDGSNTSGFQRTALIAEDGYIKTKEGKVRVDMLALEEDSARNIEKTSKNIVYRLDRLGIPLIELRTKPDIKTPEQAKESARKIGMLMRMTGNVKRGLGTIRQDVNVSIKKGSRVELKGVQNLNEIPKIIKLEIERQQNIIEIKKILKKRKSNLKKDFKEISKIFSKTKSKLIKNALKRDEKILAVKLSGFNDLTNKKIQADKHLGKDMVEYVKTYTGIKGFIHSDELPNYGISKKELFQIRKFLKCAKKDAFAFVIGDKAEEALSYLVDRCTQYKKGVPKDVRNVTQECVSEFLRPIPGSARMYPETDHIPIRITKKYFDSIEKPKTPEERLKKFKKLGISKNLAKQILRSVELQNFEEFIKKFKKINPTIIASTLISARNEIGKKYNVDSSNISKKHFKETFELLNKDKIAKEAINKILAHLASNPEKSAEEIMKKLKIQKISINKLRKIIDKTLSENEELTEKKEFGILMGLIMRKVRGKIDGEIIAKELKNKLN